MGEKRHGQTFLGVDLLKDKRIQSIINDFTFDTPMNPDIGQNTMLHMLKRYIDLLPDTKVSIEENNLILSFHPEHEVGDIKIRFYEADINIDRTIYLDLEEGHEPTFRRALFDQIKVMGDEESYLVALWASKLVKDKRK